MTTLTEIASKSLLRKKKYKIMRVDQTESFWFSSNKNIDTKIFSPKDVYSYWIIIEEAND